MIWTLLLILFVSIIRHIESSGVKVLYESPTSNCYANGRAQQCKPSFNNIAENVAAHVTSTCGDNGPEQICRNWYPHRQYCTICHNNMSHPAKYLTDQHIHNNQTCWFSGSINKPGQSVNITLPLRKRYEIYFVALQLCGTLPDSIAIYKSSNFGVTWTPWHLFSQDCYRAFRMPTTNDDNFQITQANLHEVLCVQLKQPHKYNDLGQAEVVIPFSPTNGRPSQHPWSDRLIDWMTATDIRVSMLRFPPEDPNSGRRSYRDTRSSGSWSGGMQEAPSVVHYGLSDVSLGGRCKCNGHASRCLSDSGGSRIFCDCQHNTEGQDCERCRPGYLDQPWGRATRDHAAACKQCECHLHSLQCKFDRQVFISTNYTSGAVCIDCQHNTQGRMCDSCAHRHYRDWSKPFRHRSACLPCKCHSLGSENTNECDQLTGQCKCKQGVTGRTCDRCKAGYRQIGSKLRPCVPSASHDSMANTSPACKRCNEKRKRIQFKKFCRRKSIFSAKILSKEMHGSLIRYEMKIVDLWRVKSPANKDLLPLGLPALHSYHMWIHEASVRCNCPNIELGGTYLVLARSRSHVYRGGRELLLDKRSVVLPWQESWRRRLYKFQMKEMQGKCRRFRRKGATKSVGSKSSGKGIPVSVHGSKVDQPTKVSPSLPASVVIAPTSPNKPEKSPRKPPNRQSNQRYYNTHYGYYGTR